MWSGYYRRRIPLKGRDSFVPCELCATVYFSSSLSNCLRQLQLNPQINQAWTGWDMTSTRKTNIFYMRLDTQIKKKKTNKPKSLCLIQFDNINCSGVIKLQQKYYFAFSILPVLPLQVQMGDCVWLLAHHCLISFNQTCSRFVIPWLYLNNLLY